MRTGKMRWASLPFLVWEPLFPLLDVIKILYIFISSHTHVLKATILDFLISSHGSAEDTQPTPLVVEQAYCVISTVLSTTQWWTATPRPHTPFSPLCCALSLLHHSPFSQTLSPLPGILSLCLSFLLNCCFTLACTSNTRRLLVAIFLISIAGSFYN